MKMSVVIDYSDVLKALGNYQYLKKGVLRGLFGDTAKYAERVFQMRFLDNAGRRGLHGQGGADWPGIPWPFKVIRANISKGKGRIKTIEDAKNVQAPPLQNEGVLKTSFIAAKTPSAVVSGPMFGEAGSSSPLARIHHLGIPQQFHFDRDKQKKFDWNVAKTLPGRKKSKTKSGKKSTAKKNWNPEYFQMRGVLQKMDGKQIKIRSRLLWPPDFPNAKDHRNIDKIVKLRLQQMDAEASK